MIKHNIRLSSAEIGGLWGIFIQDSMTICLLKYFLYHNQDEEIKPLLEKSLRNSENHIQEISNIFSKEGIPLPDQHLLLQLRGQETCVNHSQPVHHIYKA